MTAQDDPFGGGDPDANPFGAPAAAALGDDGALVERARQDEARPASEADPVLLAIQESNPTTPAQLLRAAKWLIQLDRRADARPYVNRVVQARPAPEELFQLHQEFGASFLMKLRRDPELAPEGDELGRAVLMAAHEAVRDKDRLAALTGQLQSNQLAQRRAAIVDLRDAGDDAVVYLLEVLADSSKSTQHSLVAAALPYLGGYQTPILIGALDAPSPAFRSHVIHALSRTGNIESAVYLLAAALSQSTDAAERQAASKALKAMLGGEPALPTALRHLRDRVDRLLRGDFPLGVPANGEATLWTWSEQLGTCRETPMTAREAAAAHAARLAKDLRVLSPDNPDDQLRFALAQLAAGQVSADRGADFDSQAVADLPLPLIQSALAHALQADLIESAIGAVVELGRRGGPEQLDSNVGQPGLLVRAALHSDERLRLATLQAIMQLAPTAPYSGSSRVLEGVQQIISSAGRPRVLIGDPRAASGQSMAALFSQQGLLGEWADTGREVFRRAAERGDYEMVLISDVIDSPNAMETLQWLRRDPRTAGLRVAILARADADSEAAFQRGEELLEARRPIDQHRRRITDRRSDETTELERWEKSQLTEAEVALLTRRADFRERMAAEEGRTPAAPRARSTPPLATPLERRSALVDQSLPYEGLFRAQAIAADDPLTWAFVRPHSDHDAALIVRQMLGSSDLARPTTQERLERAAQALQWLVHAEKQGLGSVYDLFRCETAAIEAMWMPQLTASAAPLVGALGSHRCQRALTDLASDNGLPLSARQAAVAAFREAVARRGVLLKRLELLNQYDRYNASETLDPEAQGILGEILDIIEAPSRVSAP